MIDPETWFAVAVAVGIVIAVGLAFLAIDGSGGGPTVAPMVVCGACGALRWESAPRCPCQIPPLAVAVDATIIRIEIEQPPRPLDPPNAVDLDLDQAEEFVEELKRKIIIARLDDV